MTPDRPPTAKTTRPPPQGTGALGAGPSAAGVTPRLTAGRSTHTAAAPSGTASD
jgi:hypothetical protein